ncbi:MAG: hypothetical protein A2X70_06960 [Alphaproteobacteria bacterium GWC2_42_16]|nr:MAG: hypothetical protein A2X70_06960 [Alphaproteobacteria bacterium GWC2_42_16]OFW73783.1 MAG: hypothetical protein A2Z80_03185 [Alphaproteobacteria bacterium GWA2_41_27]OFW82044.1 MAG: hypothetical protein A3E50_01450 [Alphaproteobacteria bacterium RIFCSPHIGHO2_12_FULL_42_100]OFW85801.1 MAG: hypothetical protein A2W06_02830 [Alphaproteobacteria bacterium RBG_16_42_14]OFW91188.1 MAG: hypothetical protein A3C41_06975 [Alphaproteobacteria bacterium RIFCSPHIGHO2_02_FULL_42_30]OFW93279.1 MAG: 
MLRICIRIENPVLRDAICEILPQAGLQVLEEEKGSAAILYTPPYEERDIPALNFETFSRPFKLLDLLSRLKNLPYSQEIYFSHFILKLREKTLTNLKIKEDLRLTEKECQLLRLFSLNKGEDLSKETLLKEVWKYHPEAETHTLETHIYRLRQKIEDDPNSPQILLNGKEGYFIKN